MIQGFPKKKDPNKPIDDEVTPNTFEEGRNQCLNECSSAVMKMLDKGRIARVIQLRYFKLMHPNITESDAKIVADVLAQAFLDYMKGGV